MSSDTDDREVSPGFVVATERSGSNLVRLLINAHPDVSAPHPFETAFPAEDCFEAIRGPSRRPLVRDVLVGKQHSHHPFNRPLDIDDVVARVGKPGKHPRLDVQRAIYDTYATAEGARRWMSKDPTVFEYAERALNYYDDPRFVYLVRDARDVALSFKNSHVAGIHHPYYAVKRWTHEQSVGMKLLNRHSDRIHLVKYEELLQDPESVVKVMFSFLDLKYHPEVMYYYKTDDAKSAAESASAFENVTNPIQSDNYEKFRDQLPDEEVALVEKLAHDQLEFFDYDLVHEESELEAFELDEARYESMEAEIAGRRQREQWRDTPKEEIQKRLLSGFKYYMKLRYAVLDGR